MGGCGALCRPSTALAMGLDPTEINKSALVLQVLFANENRT